VRLLIITDAWFPQINGVVRTLSTTRDKLIERGHQVEVLAPERFKNIPCPTYPEIRLALCTPASVGGSTGASVGGQLDLRPLPRRTEAAGRGVVEPQDDHETAPYTTGCSSGPRRAG